MGRKKAQRSPRGTGSFTQRASGMLQYRITYRDEYGQSKRKAFTGKTKDECLEKCEEFYKDIERLNRGIAINATITELVEARYKLDYEMNFKGEQGYHRALETLQIIKRSPLGAIPIADISKTHIQLFLASITNYSNSVLEKVFLQLKLAFSEAVNKEIIIKNVMDDRDIRRPKSNKETKKVRGYTIAEQKRILEMLETHMPPKGRNSYKKQLLIELYTGLRMGEINALKPEDIDLQKGIIKVRRTVSLGKNGRPFINRTTKTYAGQRDVPITDFVRPVLLEALAEMKNNPEGLIFYDFLKMHIVTTNQVNNYFRRICEKAGLEFNGQHALRHTYATRCIESNIPPLVLKTWMGHTDIHVTLDTYADVFDSLNNESVERLDDFLAGALS